MAVFDRHSRYLKFSTAMAGVDMRGRDVNWLLPARIPQQNILGEHRIKQGQRLDRLSAHYLDDPAGFWRVAHANDAMSADALGNDTLIEIPVKDI